MTIPISAYLRKPRGPIAYALSQCSDEVGNPATAGVAPSIFPDVESFLANGYWNWTRINRLGIKGMWLEWWAGQGATNYTAGTFPGGYPGHGGDPVTCTPLNEALHIAAVGTSYLEQWEPAIASRSGTMYRPKIYMGPPAIDCGTTLGELRANSNYAASMNAEIQWDATGVIDYSDPDLPARMAREDLVTRGHAIETESWDLRGISGLEGWMGSGFGGSVSNVASAVQDPMKYRGDIAIGSPDTWHNPVTIRAAGGRPFVILDTNATTRQPTNAETIARMAWWMAAPRFCDVALPLYTFTDKEILQVVTISTAMQRLYNRTFIVSRTARTFMRPTG